MHKQAAADWLKERGVAAAAAVGAALLLGLWLWARPSASFSNRELGRVPAGKLDQAIAAAQERLKADPQDIAALLELGTLHFQKGKDAYPDAINELEEARDLGALDSRIFYCLGIMYQEVGLYPFALDEYRRFLRHYPDDKEIRLLEAKLLYRQAAQTLAQASGRRDKEGKALSARAADEFGQAVSEYERLRYQYPKDVLVAENLGLSLWGAGATDRAAEAFAELQAKGGDAGRRADFYLGEIAFSQGRFPAAVDDFLQCEKPPVPASLGLAAAQVDVALAGAYEKLKQPEPAAAAWQKALTENPDDAQAKAAKTALRRAGRRSSKKRRG